MMVQRYMWTDRVTLQRCIGTDREMVHTALHEDGQSDGRKQHGTHQHNPSRGIPAPYCVTPHNPTSDHHARGANEFTEPEEQTTRLSGKAVAFY